MSKHRRAWTIALIALAVVILAVVILAAVSDEVREHPPNASDATARPSHNLRTPWFDMGIILTAVRR